MNLKFTFLYLMVMALNFTGYSQIFAVGNGAGDVMACYTQANNLSATIYSVGADSGSVVSCYDQNWTIYGVGNDDGFVISCLTQADNVSATIYSVGIDDGFTVGCHAQTANTIYAVGNNDGFDFSCIGSVGAEVPLPVELLNFKAYPKDRWVYLEWETATEINNDYFTVEKSKNATDWVIVTKVAGAGNSNDIHYYDAIDKTPYYGTSYYRLKQTDFDGRFEYSDIRVVNIAPKNIEVVIYPNPTNGQITIQANQQELSNLHIYNTLGQEVTNHAILISKTETSLILDFGNLANGMYFVKTLTTVNIVEKQ